MKKLRWGVGVFLMFAFVFLPIPMFSLQVQAAAFSPETVEQEQQREEQVQPVAEQGVTPVTAENSKTIVLSRESLNRWAYSVLGILVLLGAGWIFIQWRTSRTGPAIQVDKTFSQTSQIAASQKHGLSIELPYGIFPGDYMKSVNEKDLEEFMRQSKNAAVNVFMRELGDATTIPKPAQLKAAQDHLAKELSQRVTQVGTFELLSGNTKLSDKEIQYLRQCGDELLPAIRVPDPVITPGDINSWVLCGIVCAGTIGGFLLGGMIGRWGLGLSPDAGLLLGGALGAPLSLAVCLFLANNPKYKKWVFGITGSVALLDITSQYFKGMIPLPPWIKGNNKAFYKRLIFYAVIVIVVLIVKRDKTFDREQYRETLDRFVEQWLRSALPVFAVLLLRKQDVTVIHEQTDLTKKLFQITADLRLMTGDSRKTGVQMLVQEFISGGYTFPPLGPAVTETALQQEKEVLGSSISEPSPVSVAPKTLIWEESLKEQYTTFGLIESGTTVTINKFPVIQHGKVVEKGLVSD